MKMSGLFLTIIFTLCISSIHGGETIKYASGCSVNLCVLKNNGNTPCANQAPCYSFDTSINTSICALQVACSLFDPCTSVKRCTTNNSVCVINTCCASPVCIPLSLTTACSMYTANNTKNSQTVNICPNATWSENSTIVLNSTLNSTYWASFGDFYIDNSNNIFVIDSGSSRVLKYALNNPSVYTVAALTNVPSTYYAQSLFVDSNGYIYTGEYGYQNLAMTTYYRVVKYDPNSVSTGTVIYGPSTCGSSLSEICGSAGLFVDRTGLVYYSDSSNHRVLKITPMVSTATVVAGTSGMSGSQLNQLNYPAGISVDGNGALYVADQNNYRVLKFASGSLTGTVLFTTASYQAPVGLTLDSVGSVYVGTYSGVFKYIPSSGNTIQLTTQMYWSINRIRFDTYGNMYTGGYSSSNIYKYNLTLNIC